MTKPIKSRLSFYAFDVIKQPNGSYKFIDFHGMLGGGLNAIQYSYGNIRRIKDYLRILNKYAKGKIQFVRKSCSTYITPSPSNHS